MVLCAAWPARPAHADEPRRGQWEYRCIDEPRPEDLEPVLDRWGEDGWELAARVQPRLCFKRSRLVPASTLRACRPGCGASDHCVDGRCVPCAPSCRSDELCSPAGVCVAGPREGGAVGAGAAEVAAHWQPTRDEFAAARAVLQPTLDRCGADAREDGPALIALTILGSGTVTATHAGQSTLSPPTLRCIEEAARALRFRPFRAALISVDMPVVVRGVGPAPPSRAPPPSAPVKATPPAPAAVTPPPPRPPSKLSD